jgi:hypothetical protein
LPKRWQKSRISEDVESGRIPGIIATCLPANSERWGKIQILLAYPLGAAVRRTIPEVF